MAKTKKVKAATPMMPVEELSPFDQNKATILSFLKAIGAVRAEIEFSGSGDSGQFDSIMIEFPAKEEGGQSEYKEASKIESDVKLSILEVPVGQYDAPNASGELPLAEALETMGDAVLKRQGYDWYNNDGGQGSITFDVTENKIIANTGVNHIETTHYNDEY